jgi:hypothetical protein
VQPENKSIGYPIDFNFFVDKKMLFKVEVSDGNINRKWRNYGVKRATDDVEVINEFIKKYNLKVFFCLYFFVLSYRYGFLRMPLYIRILTRKKLSF